MNNKFDQLAKYLSQWVKPSAASLAVCGALGGTPHNAHAGRSVVRLGWCEGTGQGCRATTVRTWRLDAAFPPEDKCASRKAPARAFRAQGSLRTARRIS